MNIPTTRSTIVLKLPQDVQVYLQEDVSSTTNEILIRSFKCSGLSIRKLRNKIGGSHEIEMEIKLFNKQFSRPLATIVVQTPSFWTPRMYVAMIQQSLIDDKMLIIGRVDLEWGGIRNFKSINNIFLFYDMSQMNLSDRLSSEGFIAML